jgi:hypothetical protein
MRCLYTAMLVTLTATFTTSAENATGIVFHDINGNARHDAGEPGLPNIRVSNGQQVVKTDNAGRYTLPADDDTPLFVIKPRDWMTRVDALNIPRFYYLHKPAGSPRLKYSAVEPTGPLPASIDFPLYQRPEPDRFKVLLFGDSQPYSIQEVDYFAHDVIEQVIGTDAAFGMSLGDLVGDNLDLHNPLNLAQAHIGIPMYNVIGNHDMDYAARDDRHSDDHHERVYGPPYFSFDYGPVHFIVLDSIIWYGAEGDRKGHYKGGLGQEQLTFLENDLAYVDKDQLVVVTMHIPMIEFIDREQLYALLAKHRHTVSFSAHWHVHRHFFLDADDGWPGEKPHHHTTLVTTCGSWWRGAPDEVGIPHTVMRDGAPNGWCIATFDRNRYAVEFVPARRPASYQMNIHAPETITRDQAAETEILVNVFAGSERSTVRMRLDNGPFTTLKRVERPDPYYAELKKAEESKKPPRGRKLPRLENSHHLWAGYLPASPAPGSHLIEVRTTDMFGHTYTGYRIIRVNPNAPKRAD